MDGLKKALRFIEEYDDFLLTTHEGPDADGLGAEIVLAKALSFIGKSVRIVNSVETSPRYAFLDPEGILERFDESKHGSLIQKSSLFVLDNADTHNLGISFDTVLPRVKDIFAIDHHESAMFDGIKGYIDTSASSTCELVLRLVDLMGAPLDAISARAGYAGIVYDTGSFIYPKTSANTFMAALRLVQAGAVPSEIHRSMYESASIGVLILQKLVLSTLEMHAGNRIAIQSMSKEDLSQAGAGFEDAEPLINTPLRSKDVEVSIMFKENPEGLLRCSLRSKGTVNVSVIAQKFGGGGHKTAAGFKCGGGIAQTKSEVLLMVSAGLGCAANGDR